MSTEQARFTQTHDTDGTLLTVIDAGNVSGSHRSYGGFALAVRRASQ